jgi:hypothetical protein
MAKWQMIFTTTEIHRADLAKGLLAERNIEAVVLNKRDSSYTLLGHYELLVQPEDVLQAINILKNEIHFE